MKRTTILALVMAAATWVSADTVTGRQRIQVYGRLVAASPASRTVMVERIDGTLWTYRVDARAMAELATLRAGDEVAITFIYDGPGTDDGDVIADFDLLPQRQRADWPMPFGIVAGTSIVDAGFVRTARGGAFYGGGSAGFAADGTGGGGTLGFSGTSASRTGATNAVAQGIDPSLAVRGSNGQAGRDAQGANFDGTVSTGTAGGVVTGNGTTSTTSSGLLPGLTTPGAVLIDGRNLAATAGNAAAGFINPATTADTLTADQLARPQAVGSFTPGSTAPNVQNTAATFPSSGQLARPAAQTGFTPGSTAPGVVDEAAGRAGVRTTPPSVTGQFTPGTVAPGVRDTAITAGSETLTPSVPTSLVTPNNPLTNTGNGGATTTAAGGGTATTGTTTTATGGAAVAGGGGTRPSGQNETGGATATPSQGVPDSGARTTTGRTTTTTTTTTTPRTGTTSGTTGTSTSGVGGRTGTSTGTTGTTGTGGGVGGNSSGSGSN